MPEGREYYFISIEWNYQINVLALLQTCAMVTVSMEHSRPILRISSLMLRSLLSVICTPGNRSQNFSLSSFFMSDGLTYSMMLVCK